MSTIEISLDYCVGPRTIGRVERGGGKMSEWKKLHDGELVLAGTVMAIIYQPGRDGDFAIYSGRRYQWSCITLARAKKEAEAILAELVEIGAA